MQAVDAAVQASTPLDVLVERAGHAVALVALEMMGGAYGRRVLVVAGKGNNGADGRIAAGKLRRRGARVTVVEAGGVDGGGGASWDSGVGGRHPVGGEW